MEEIRLGSIGSGPIVHTILGHAANTEGIRLEAVCSRSAEKGRALAEQYSCRKAYADLDAFFADEAVNVVYIASPNLLHYEQTKRALSAGKHVVCEKPFVTRLDQARELAALAKEKGLMLAEAAPTSFLPNFRILREQLPRIGRLRLVNANYAQYSSRYDAVLRGELPNVFNLAFAGGCLMDINFYNVYLNVALFGKPRRALYAPNCLPGLADSSGVLLLWYDGFVSTNAAAKDAVGVNFFQIEGEKGYICVENGANGLAKLRVVTKDADESFNEQPVPDRWYYEVRELTRLLRAEDFAALEARLKITLDTVELMEAARKEAGLRFPGDL